MTDKLDVKQHNTAFVKTDVRCCVGEQIRKARVDKGLTTRQLADMCGLSQSHIVRIESGRYAVTIDSIGIIAIALGIRISIG